MDKLRDYVSNIPLKDRMMTVFLIKGGEVYQAKTKAEKESASYAYTEGDTLFCVWTGKWSSDGFNLTVEQLKAALW